ncbi:MAG: hypothetical protein FD123_3535 [Bacteroidetes bacterium]|nr:MAG: hypothetical protein FD123_3535 [Bacteroidota bacterium]
MNQPPDMRSGAWPEAQEAVDFLKRSESSLLYVSPGYLGLLGEYLQPSKQELLRCVSGGKTVGYFPLVFRLNEQFGNVCNSLPYYGSNGSIIVDPALAPEEREDVRLQLLHEAQKKISDYNCVSATVITNPLDQEGAGWIRDHFEHDLIDQRIGQLTPLPAKSERTGEELLEMFDDPRPRNIRRAIKEGISVRYTQSPKDIDFLYEVHHENITSIGGIPKERRFFHLLPKHFDENGFRIYIAELNGEKIAALLLFYFNRTVEYFTPAVVEKHRQLQPSALLIYKAMADAVDLDYRWWNWGGTWLSQGGVYDFKKRWGTQDYPYFYYTKIYDEGILSCDKETLLREYPYFFVAPFNKLKQANQT